jgi:hypothetical protein
MSDQTPTEAEFLAHVRSLTPEERACVLACAHRGNAGMPSAENLARLERELAEARR